MQQMTTIATNRLDVESLNDESRFTHLLTLRFDEITAFVKEYYWKHRTPVIYAHIIITLVLLGWMLADFTTGEALLADWLMAWGGGLIGFFLLLPLHEAIHGLAYRLYGAKDIRYGIEWRQGLAYATAHHFVIDGRRFAWVALAPFLVLNAALLTAIAFLPEYRLLLLGVLTWHTMGTSGDFAMLNYCWLHRDRQLYTWDDADTKTSYFYEAR